MECETCSAIGTTLGTPAPACAVGMRLVGSICTQGTGRRQCGDAGWKAQPSRGDVCVGRALHFFPILGLLSPQFQGLRMFGVVVCVCICMFLILKWIMRCKDNNYSDLYSNLYVFLYQCNLLRTFIFKIQECFKVLISN